MYDSWDTEFFALLTTQRINILKKWKKPLEISFYTSLPEMTIIWYMIPEISARTDRFFCHLGPFFALLPTNSPKNENFKKMKKTPGDIILHKCTKNHDHRLYCSWDKERDKCNYFSFWVIFCPFTLLTTQKTKISKKRRRKKHPEVSSFNTSYQKSYMLYCSWEMALDV